MLDFLKISSRQKRAGVIEIYPRFRVGKSKDLMIRGGDFYAIWIEERGLWSTDEEDVIHLIDKYLDEYYKENKSKFDGEYVRILHMWDSETGVIDLWHKYCQKQLRDNYTPLDENVIFSNKETKKEDYATKKLSYSLEENGKIGAWDELVSTLYFEDERHKIEWCIGACVSGDSKHIQKFAALYGPPGSGKSTILNIIMMLFEEYHSVFDAESLGSASDIFAMEQFRNNPLIAVSHDGDLSRIERNTRLNSLISHESMSINVKHKSSYTMRFNSFLWLGTNKFIKITDAKSGLLRRLIDIHPSGNKVPFNKYNRLMKQISFELGAIAYHCLQIYLEDTCAYNDYRPIQMMSESNDFYNFVSDSYQIFKKDDGVSQQVAWKMYKTYCDDAKVLYPLPFRAFGSELRNYFKEFKERVKIGDDSVRSYYMGFKTDMFETKEQIKPRTRKKKDDFAKIDFREQPSKLDIFCSGYPAQYGYETGNNTPKKPWADVKTILNDIDTSKVHWLKVPNNLIIIDFDLTDENGEKSFEKNLEEASKWPKTYAELSKSGGGIHLHYIYNGDPTQLSRMYADNIEIKVFTGNSSLRRKLTRCNDEDINTINSGLPKKESGRVVNFEAIKNEKALRTLIKRNLNKEYLSATKPSMDFIFKNLEDAYNSGMHYDVSDLYNAIVAFASSSSNQADYCLKLIPKMKFKSNEASKSVIDNEKPIVFYDIEIFPNLFILNWKFQGKEKKVNRLINPTPIELEKLLQYRLVGFNCRRYDNHIFYGALIGYSNIQLYNLSKRIINEKSGFFGEAYNISYTDVYDYAKTKQSLKKWQVELGIRHQELGLPWDEPVPEHLWPKVAEYCDNDVIATEAVFDKTKGDFLARIILAQLADMSENDTTNTLTTKLIFGNNKKPNLQYADKANDILRKEFPGYEFIKTWNDITKKYDKKNMYRGVDLSLGGYVYDEPGMYGKVGLLDVASMHPNTIIALNLFGEYTPIFAELVQVRIDIKHGDYEHAKTSFGGKLAPYLNDKSSAEALSDALKIAINSVYGLTSASFDNPFRDYKNENNIVAVRGALFMKTLQDAVVEKGFRVVHVKTDSIKIPDITDELIIFCQEFAKKYGYEMEHEATYDKFCLVNKAVYIAKYDEFGIRTKSGKHANKWTATGTQFAVPYVFKMLFSKEEIEFRDLCEVKEVAKSSIYLNMNEGLFQDENNLKFIGRVGLFCPIKPGCGGGELVKPVNKKDGSVTYDSVTGAKGYRWIEADEVYEKDLMHIIDTTYYDRLVDNAVKEINKYGDFEWFVSDEPYIGFVTKNQYIQNQPYI